MAYLAYYLHWPHDDIMALDHKARRTWIEETVKINRRASEEG